jgi:histidinol phosphatase-like enzyme
MVGDDMRDVNAGINAGCIPVFLTNNKAHENITVENFINLKEFTDSL